MNGGGLAALRAAMNRALNDQVAPLLLQRGFSGRLPHFRRFSAEKTDLITFQFDRYGGGFVIALAEGPAAALVKSWGKTIPPKRLTAYDINPPARRRLQPGPDRSTTASWFRFDDGTPCEIVAQRVITYLEQIDAWFEGRKDQPNIR